ncbi:MAG: hypothetical protein Kow00105_16990 [Phycisphaeraceae bacterium]
MYLLILLLWRQKRAGLAWTLMVSYRPDTESIMISAVFNMNAAQIAKRRKILILALLTFAALC